MLYFFCLFTHDMVCMVETRAVIATLKHLLKERQITYAAVAQGLEMSEANVKRLFASQRITLDRLEAICRLLGIGLVNLFEIHEASRQRLSQLSEAQERELVEDNALLLVAVAVRNHLDFEQMLRLYHFSESELIRKLAQLDRLKIIELLPQNRIKLRIAENFRWIPNGPIEQFYERAIQNEFLQRGFDHDQNPRLFLSALLSEHSVAIINQRLLTLSHEVTELHRQDRDVPIEKRKNIGCLLALREWEFSALVPYIKNPSGM